MLASSTSSIIMDELESKMIAAGVKPSVIAVTIGIVRGLSREGVDWETVTGAELVKRCTGHTARLHRLRRGLSYAYNKKEASQRWPEVFRRTNARGQADNPKQPTLEKVLPVELTCRNCDDPVRQVFEKLYKRLSTRNSMKLTSTFRVNLSFLYGFLCATPVSLWPDAHAVTIEDLESRVKALTHVDLLHAYDRYRQESSRVKRNLSLKTLCTQLNVLNVVFRDIFKVIKRPLSCSDFGIANPKQKTREKKQKSGSEAASTVGNSTATSALSVFNTDIPIVDRSTGWVHKVQKKKVHCFNASEVRALYLNCQTDLEKLLMAALFTTGMRIGGFCLTKREPAITGESPSGIVVGPEMNTNEKYDRERNYPIAPSLEALLPAWVASGGCGDVYLFPGTPGGERPLDTRRARAIFMEVAKRAGLKGGHVKPHTTRHTVCWTLSAIGNKLNDIAVFAGHRNVNVTNDVYIAMEEAQKRSRMDIPWLERNGRRDAEQLQEMALELAGAIAGPFASVDGRTFPDYKCSRQQSMRRNTFQEPTPGIINEENHRTVTAASLERAERKAERKNKKKEIKEQLQKQMAENGELLKRLLSSNTN